MVNKPKQFIVICTISMLCVLASMIIIGGMALYHSRPIASQMIFGAIIGIVCDRLVIRSARFLERFRHRPSRNQKLSKKYTDPTTVIVSESNLPVYFHSSMERWKMVLLHLHMILVDFAGAQGRDGRCVFCGSHIPEGESFLDPKMHFSDCSLFGGIYQIASFAAKTDEKIIEANVQVIRSGSNT